MLHLVASLVGLFVCADPTAPSTWVPALLPAYRMLASLYDALMRVGAC